MARTIILSRVSDHDVWHGSHRVSMDSDTMVIVAISASATASLLEC